MSSQYHQSQYILNKCFNNKQKIVRVNLNTTQDYLNAVFDNSKDALRVSIDGGMMPTITDVDDLPTSAVNGQIAPIYNENTDSIEFYVWLDGEGAWTPCGTTLSGSSLTEDEKTAVAWLSTHLDQVKDVADYNYIVNVEDVVLDANDLVVTIQGNEQNIDDDLDGDNDVATPYRIDVAGYVLSVSTYSDSSAVVPDNYHTKIVYESGVGGLGLSHIYLQQGEFEYFAGLTGGKNIIRVFYLTNVSTSPVKKLRLTLGADGQVTDGEGLNYSISDTSDTDGDITTEYCISVPGYALGVETYASQEAKVSDKCIVKTVYETDGIYSGYSKIYLDQTTYDASAALTDGKNIIDVYYLHRIFPASVIISETQYMFPSDHVEPVAIDASGNVHKIDDTLVDDDGDAATHIKITVGGYTLDMEGYSSSSDTFKRRLIVKMSYNPGIDTTDIYIDTAYYEQISQLENGRNVVSIFSVSAGIGIDADRVLSASSPTATLTALTGTAVNVAPGQRYEWTMSGNCSIEAPTGWSATGAESCVIYITAELNATLSSTTTIIGENDAIADAGVYECYVVNYNGALSFRVASFTEAEV